LQAQQPAVKILALAENGGHHIAYSNRAKKWIDSFAVEANFSVSYISDTKPINSSFLAQFQLFIQLDYPPYGWTDTAAAAFTNAIEQGSIGWLGFHHASLLGEFDGYKVWPWFRQFMGNFLFTNYIAGFARATVVVEDTTNALMRNVPYQFVIDKDEWYTYDRSPRADVHVIARVDESTYYPATDIRMGDHPVIWSNPRYPHTAYIFMGHSPELFNNPVYTTIFRNAIRELAVK
jgi:type 1 glutamine amidotransferase